MSRLLSICSIATCFILLIIGSALVQASEFDVEAIKSQYTGDGYYFKKLPEKGYNYYAIAEDTYYVHDNFEGMSFIVTEVGVVVIDPISFTNGPKDKPLSTHTLEAISEVTDKPVTHVIYTHHHRDHSQGAHLFPESATFIAHKRVAYFMALANDPKRPAPDVTWEGEYVLETGGLRLEFKSFDRSWHSQQDTLVYAPQKKVLFAIDTFHAEAAPWVHFGESADPMFAWMLPQLLLDTYEFNFMVTGHERIIATREALEVYRDLVADMKKIVMEVFHDPVIQTQMAKAKTRFNEGVVHPFYKEVWNINAHECAQRVIKNWAGKLRNIELNAVENCQTMFAHLIILDP